MAVIVIMAFNIFLRATAFNFLLENVFLKGSFRQCVE